MGSLILHDMAVSSDKYTQYSLDVCSVTLHFAYGADNSAASRSFMWGVSHLLPW